MGNRLKIAKRALALIFVFILSINSFGAISSDNDGSSFITKAEFDSLKNSFQTQIDSYNQGIDSKIDNAIAAYLAGIHINVKPTDLYDSIKAAIGADLWFKNGIKGGCAGASAITSQFTLNLTRRLYYKYYTNLVNTLKMSGFNNAFKYDGSGNVVANTYGQIYFEDLLKAKENAEVGISNVLCGQGRAWRFFPVDAGTGTGTSKSWGEQAFDNLWPSEWNLTATGQETPTVTKDFNYNNNYMNKTKNQMIDGYILINNMKSVQQEGTGSAWVYHVNPDGQFELREYAKEFFPIQSLDFDAHTYKNFAPAQDSSSWTAAWLTSHYGKPAGLSDTTAFSKTIAPSIAYGTTIEGTRVDDDDTNEKKEYSKYVLSLMKTTDLIDYSIYQWGSHTTDLIYCVEDRQNPELGDEVTIDADSTSTTFIGPLYTPQVTKTTDNNLSGVDVKYTPVKFNTTAKSLNNFYNSYVSTIAGQVVYLGGGIPIAYNQENTMRAIVKFKAIDADGNPVSNEMVHYVFSDKQFKNGAVDIAQNAKNLGSGTIAVNTPVTIEFVGEGYLWVNIYANTPLYDVSIDTVTLSN